jgi:hypothetical protein
MSSDHWCEVKRENEEFTVGLVADDSLDVDDPFLSVDSNNLALTSLEVSANNGDLIILADGERTDLKGRCYKNVIEMDERRWIKEVAYRESEREQRLTLCFSFSSLDRGEAISFLFWMELEEKWFLLCVLREDATST